MRLIGTRTLFPTNHQGLVIDVIFIVANAFIFPILTSNVKGLFESSFRNDEGAFATLGFLMLLILAGRLGGLYLKRFPMHSRLESSDETSFPAYFFVFSTPVLILTAAFVNTAVTALLGSLGLLEVSYAGVPKETPVTMFVGLGAMIVVIVAEIWFIFRLTRPLTNHEKKRRAAGDLRYTKLSELGADFGLFAYMTIWQVFYNVVVVPAFMDHPNGTPSVEHQLISIIFLALCFMLFYVAPRVVFLIEDRKHIGTWLLITGVFIASIARYVV